MLPPPLLDDIEDPVLPAIPPRSRLFHLPPIGLGTRRVESLTSYTSRLAQAHSITAGTLFTRDIAYTIEHGHVPKGLCTGYTATKRAGEGVNNLTPTARAWVHAVGLLTLRRDLLPLTLLHWEGLIHPMGLMRERKAWCPVCYQEGQDIKDERDLREEAEAQERLEAGECSPPIEESPLPGVEPYDQLLWTLQDVTCCADHGCRLVSICPHCDEDSPHLGWQARPGYCNSCYEWLGTTDVDTKSVTSWDRWRAEQIGALLALPTDNEPVATRLAKQRIPGALRTVALARGIKKTGRLAKLLGFRREGVVDWYYGHVYPSFSSLLVICAKLRVGLLEFLFADLKTLETSEPDGTIPDPPERQYRRRPKSELEAVLLDALQNGDPSESMRTICERAGWGRSGAHANCPELSQKVTARRREYFLGRTSAKKAVVLDEARRLIQRLRSEGENLPPMAIARRLPKPGVLRSTWGREAFSDALAAEGVVSDWPCVRSAPTAV